MHNDKNRRRLLFYLHERKKNVTQNFTINVNLIGFEFTQTVKGGSIIFFYKRDWGCLFVYSNFKNWIISLAILLLINTNICIIIKKRSNVQKYSKEIGIINSQKKLAQRCYAA